MGLGVGQGGVGQYTGKLQVTIAAQRRRQDDIAFDPMAAQFRAGLLGKLNATLGVAAGGGPRWP